MYSVQTAMLCAALLAEFVYLILYYIHRLKKTIHLTFGHNLGKYIDRFS